MLPTAGPARRCHRSGLATLDDIAIERQLAPELLSDFSEDPGVLFHGVGIKRGHDTARTKVMNPNDDVSNAQAVAGPRTLRQTLDTANDEIRSEPAPIVPEGSNGAVGRHEQGQHIEPVGR